MGVKIGCPAVKLGTGRSKNAGKRTAKLQGVLCEGWECGIDADGRAYRLCKDADYDVTRTAGNLYVGERNAYKLGAAIQSEAMEYSARRKAAGKRAMRSTAAIGYSVILKPPAEYVNGLSAADQERLAWDLLDSFKAATADFIAEDAINAVWQTDEAGGHWHIAGPAKTPAGDIDADAIVNPRFYTALNRTLPAEMQKRKWPVDECVNYDPDAAKNMDEAEKTAYKAEAKAKRPTATGMDSKDYKAAKDAERIAELEARVKELEGLEDFCKHNKFRDGTSLAERYYNAKRTGKAVGAPQKPVEAPPAPAKAEDAAAAKPVQKAAEKPGKVDIAALAERKRAIDAKRAQKEAEEKQAAIQQDADRLTSGIPLDDLPPLGNGLQEIK